MRTTLRVLNGLAKALALSVFVTGMLVFLGLIVAVATGH